MVTIDEEDYIAHYGTPRHSGRYPWGSGGQHEPGWSPRNPNGNDTIAWLRSQGLTDKEIMKGLNISTTQFRARNTIERNEAKRTQIGIAQSLKDKGMSDTAAARQMGIPGSSYRELLKPGAAHRQNVLISTSEMLKKEVDKKKYLDVGSGVEGHIEIGDNGKVKVGTGLEGQIGISKEKLGAAVAILVEQGYSVHEVKEKQVGTGFETRKKVLVPPGVTQRDVFLNRDKIKQIARFTNDGGTTYGKVDHPPISVNPNRVGIRYKEDGGDKADGVIYVREGAKDLSLGKNRYAQVRVLVGNDHYLKGMAVYKDDLPPGTDLMFNTNKSSTGNKLDAMKPIHPDSDYPFGSVVRQILKDEGTPNERNVSAMNLVNEQGDWSKWSKTLSSQFLSKQSPILAKTQLDMTYERRVKEFDEIMALTNPTVRKKLLKTFADETDSAAVHLKSAALPKSYWHAILPVESMKPTEVYAPNYPNGTKVSLLRYPHGGTFEIPQLTVNNNQREAKKLIGPDSRDAIGIHHTVAQRMSGADFDGDTVLVIPGSKIKSTPALEKLKAFDPVGEYKLPDDVPNIKPGRKQTEMGNISNLITDMTLKGAPNEHLVRAIKHSMVVIDSEKHHLDYKRSAIENGIASLKEEYQGRANAGAATIVSRKKSFTFIPDRKARPHAQGGPIDEQGRKVFVDTGRQQRNRDGVLVPKTIKVTKLAEAHDARSLLSNEFAPPIEKLYADHSNKLKGLANRARVEESKTPRLAYSPSANKIYHEEVKSLNAKLALVIRNRPLERQAQTIANAAIRAKYKRNPHLEEGARKKIKFAEQERARQRTGAKSKDVKITDKEWNAIQAGAISDSKLSQILDKADLEIVREHATPRRQVLMTPTKTARAKQMLESGYTRAQVAEQLGVSLSTLDNATVS